MTAPSISYRLFVLGVILVAVMVWWSNYEPEPNPPPGVSCFRTSITVPVRPDGGVWFKPGYQVTQLAKLPSGEIVAPIIRISRPNYGGFMGGVRHDSVWEETFHALSEGQAVLFLPRDEQIAEHVLLVRRLPIRIGIESGEESPAADPWRIWTLRPQDAQRGPTMPAFETLPLLSEPQESDWLKKQSRASHFAMELRK